MNEYKIKQNKYTIDTVSTFGAEAKVLDKMGKYLLTSNNSVLFVDYKTNTLYRAPVNVVR